MSECADPREAFKREPHALPAHWQWLWLDKAFTFAGGAQPPASEFMTRPAPGNVRFVQIRDYYSSEHLTYVPESQNLRRCTSNDVMIARYGASLGRICRGIDGAYNVALVKASPAPGIDNDFLFYLLQTDYFQAGVQGQGARSAQAGFNREGLNNILLPIPPNDEQRAIAEVLGALDDKIAANARQLSTALSLAEAFYLKMMMGSALRPLRTIGSLMSLEYGKALPATLRSIGSIDVYGSGGVVGSHNVPLLSGPGIIVGRKGTVGSVMWSHGPFFPIDTTFYVKPIDQTASLPFCYFALRSLALEERGTDSAVPGLNRNVVYAAEVPLPPEGVISNFTEFTMRIFEMSWQLRQENAALEEAHNLVLPQLISGKLRVKDAEKQVEAVV